MTWCFVLAAMLEVHIGDLVCSFTLCQYWCDIALEFSFCSYIVGTVQLVDLDWIVDCCMPDHLYTLLTSSTWQPFALLESDQCKMGC